MASNHAENWRRYYKKNREKLLARNRTPQMREQHRAKHLRNKYGISTEKYKELFDKQNGVCAICGLPETSRWRGIVRHLPVDHDHTTGEIRGLLCTKCNSGIGHLGDDPNLLHRAILYLVGSNGEH